MSHTSYRSRKKNLLNRFDKSIGRIKPWLISRFGEDEFNSLMRDAHQEYEALIPQIPFIGKRNIRLKFLLPTSRYLALYRAMKNRGSNVEETGELILKLGELEIKAIPKIGRRVLKYLWFSQWFLSALKKRAKESQDRLYPGDFVFDFIQGDGSSFDYGVDYIECANIKFLQDQNASELMPYVCAMDKIASEMLGWGLTRTMTLAEGCAKCDFRFKKGGETSVNLTVPYVNPKIQT